MNRYRTTLLIFAVLAFNLFLRLLPFHHVFTGGNIILVDGDSYYHMRRILLIAENFPHISFYDYHMNFPEGAMSPWPPLYDFFVATIAYLAGLGSPAVRTVETVAALIPPVFGALTVLPVYFLSRRLFDERTAIWGAFFFSLVPGHIQYTFVGRPDHHAAEAFLSVLFFMFFCNAIMERDDVKQSKIAPLFAGLTLSAAMLTWTGSILYIAFAAFASLYLILKNQMKGISSRHVFYALTASALITFLTTTSYLLTTHAWHPLSYITLSGFHALVILFAFVYVSLLWVLSELFLRKGLKKLNYLAGASLIVFLAVFAVFIVAFPEFATSLHEGIFKQIGKSVPWRKILEESRPLFSVMTVRGNEFSVFSAVRMATWVILLVPVALILMFLEKREGDKAAFFALWSIPLLALTLNQMRYIYYFSANIGIIAAYLMLRGSAMMRSRYALVLPLLVTLMFFYPSFDNALYWIRDAESGSLLNQHGADAVETMLWVRERTPEAGNFLNPEEKPAYSIMNTWGFGHEMTYLARRPVVANNFADVIKGRGFPDSLKYFTSTSVEESYTVLEAHNSRFVFITAPDYYSAMAARMAGKKMPGYFTDDWKATGKALHEIVTFRLYFFDGKDIGRYRLVYESYHPAYGSVRFKKVKVFEFVKGARVKGRGLPGSEVSASLQLVSNQGREFVYENTVKAGKDGVYEFILPYASKDCRYDVRAKGGYLLASGGRKVNISVSEDDVVVGREITAGAF